MRPVRLGSVAIATLLLIALVTAASTVLLPMFRSRPVPERALAIAARGVSRNADWNPVVRRLDGIDMSLVPSGCFSMGSTTAELAYAVESCNRFFGEGRCQVDFQDSETPAHRVCFSSPYWIAETEVTNRMFGSSSSTDMVAMYRGPSWPRESVTWQQALDFCSAHHARLPTEAEWEFAARGPDGLIFPWGDEFDLELVISGRLSPENAGSIKDGASWVGALDMSGGVREWAADWYGPYSATNQAILPGLSAGQERVLRGGSWFSFAAFMLRAPHRESASPETSNSTIGFRCARDF